MGGWVGDSLVHSDDRKSIRRLHFKDFSRSKKVCFMS